MCNTTKRFVIYCANGDKEKGPTYWKVGEVLVGLEQFPTHNKAALEHLLPARFLNLINNDVIIQCIHAEFAPVALNDAEIIEQYDRRLDAEDHLKWCHVHWDKYFPLISDAANVLTKLRCDQLTETIRSMK